MQADKAQEEVFLSTLPARGATRPQCRHHAAGPISIHAPREGSDLRHGGIVVPPGVISIHAPREGSDINPYTTCGTQQAISIHAPREGSDPCRCSSSRIAWDFYPRSPRGERPGARPDVHGRNHFYPRSPRGERPGTARGDWLRNDNFYPRSPRGERRFVWALQTIELPISIHAPREGSDLTLTYDNDHVPNFYPRSPRGERPAPDDLRYFRSNFYPRSPRGERRLSSTFGVVYTLISIHAPREGSDRGYVSYQGNSGISIHAPREGSDVLK